MKNASVYISSIFPLPTELSLFEKSYIFAIMSTNVGRLWMYTHPHGYLVSHRIFFLNII